MQPGSDTPTQAADRPHQTAAPAAQGLASDQGETGRVTRIKDIIRPRAQAQRGDFALIDFASDEGVQRNHGRVGAAEGPALIRERLLRMAVHGAVHLHDHAHIACMDGDLESAQTRLAATVAEALNSGFRPIILGGGHEVSYGTFSGIVAHLGADYRAAKLGIVNLDAHFDLRQAVRRNSGTPFFDACRLAEEKGAAFAYFCAGISAPGNTQALFERADRIGARYWFDHDLAFHSFARSLEQILAAIADLSHIHLSIDLDVLQAAIAPGVSAPSPGGLSIEALEALLAALIATRKVIAIDIAEFNPRFDQDGSTAAVAARLVWRLISDWSPALRPAP